MPTVVYGAETCCLNAREKRRLNVMKIQCLRRMCGVTVMDRIRNEVIWSEVGMMRDLCRSGGELCA